MFISVVRVLSVGARSAAIPGTTQQ
jgi:hypothetical protein